MRLFFHFLYFSVLMIKNTFYVDIIEQEATYYIFPCSNNFWTNFTKNGHSVIVEKISEQEIYQVVKDKPNHAFQTHSVCNLTFVLRRLQRAIVFVANSVCNMSFIVLRFSKCYSFCSKFPNSACNLTLVLLRIQSVFL